MSDNSSIFFDAISKKFKTIYKIENSTVSNTAIISPNLEINNFIQSSNFYNNITFYLIKNSNVTKYLDISSGTDTQFFDKDTV